MKRKHFKHLASWGLLVPLLMLSSFGRAQAQTKAPSEENKKTEAPPPLRLKVGDMAPDFTLLAFDGRGLKKISLQDYRGKKNVALAFFVFAFTGG
jgi:AhpC/TSA family